MASELCPVYSPFFSAIGCSASIVLACFGAAYGTAKSGATVVATSVLHHDQMIKNTVPVIMAGIVGIYGLIVSVMIADKLKQKMSLYASFVQFGSGLTVGLSCLAAGFAIGIIGDSGVRAVVEQKNVFVGMVVILIFAEVLGLYGLIIALLMNSKADSAEACL